MCIYTAELNVRERGSIGVMAYRWEEVMAGCRCDEGGRLGGDWSGESCGGDRLEIEDGGGGSGGEGTHEGERRCGKLKLEVSVG